jgi:hypothetical protein
VIGDEREAEGVDVDEAEGGEDRHGVDDERDGDAAAAASPERRESGHDQGNRDDRQQAGDQCHDRKPRVVEHQGVGDDELVRIEEQGAAGDEHALQ